MKISAKKEGDYKSIRFPCPECFTYEDHVDVAKYFAKELEAVKAAGENTRQGIAYSVMEAVANAAIHGKGHVEIRYWLSDKTFKATIKDEGSGFDIAHWKAWYERREKAAQERKMDKDTTFYHKLDKNGAGAGLVVIHGFMDCVEFNEQGNEITLYKNL